jgi:hypothetical protein
MFGKWKMTTEVDCDDDCAFWIMEGKFTRDLGGHSRG